MKGPKSDIIHKIKIARGQLDGILQMIEDNRYCVDISNQLLATLALLKAPISRFCNPMYGTASGRLCKRMLKIQSWKKP